MLMALRLTLINLYGISLLVSFSNTHTLFLTQSLSVSIVLSLSFLFFVTRFSNRGGPPVGGIFEVLGVGVVRGSRLLLQELTLGVE